MYILVVSIFDDVLGLSLLTLSIIIHGGSKRKRIDLPATDEMLPPVN